ncbi:PREDICTED: vacuolar protein sorting-associated protein 18 homolog isoform X2 [Nicrophorus vespilloides]|uniref:Vacuolar protein sorting-associated protein 18 homolog n=1 Tax=Nicrophorus vespilloides TaxID=110193 RepID=A0ABM1NDY6_NICVS|nr:PREDICTED: vacuolar protein sorting-associated protein 18 homolog isoform X2 [Nicrophorus vespilloides]
MNILDQFEVPSQNSKINSYNNAEMSTSGYIQMSMEQEMPIFTKAKKDFTPADSITHVAISNKYLVVAMSNCVLFRMNLNNPSQQDEISISKYTKASRLTNLFLDPQGNHLLMTFAPINPDGPSELVYLARKSNKLKSSSKFRTHTFTSVAWNYNNQSEISTGTILLGTTKGLIIETEIVMEGEKYFITSGLEQYWKQLFDIGKDNEVPITGLEFFNLPGTDKHFVFASTPRRLYMFTGPANPDDKPLLQQVFNKYLNIPEKDSYIEEESSLKYSQLKFWSENLVVPNYLAWMTQYSVSYAKIDLYNLQSIKDIKDKIELIKYQRPNYGSEQFSTKAPFALALTEFHVLIAYTDMIKGMSLLNADLVYEDNYNEAFGSLVNLVKDQITGTIWAVTQNAIFRFKVTKEERHVWRIYCDKQEFELAKKYSKDNEAYYDQVLIKEANMLFESGNYVQSALCYAQTQSSFEGICLKFIQIDQQTALKVFLRKKLQNLKQQDKTQITMIVLWLIELYLNQFEEMRLKDQDRTKEFSDLEKEFEQFLTMKQICGTVEKNRRSIYEIMASHGDKANAIRLTIVHKDFEQLIRQHIYKSSFPEALDVLKSQNNRELFYQFAPILIQEIPKLVVKALIDQGRNLMPVKLLPALVSCNGNAHSLEIIKYLEHCVNILKCNEKAVHNLLLSLYAKYNQTQVMEYLNSQGLNISMVNYDVYFALRLCQEKKLTRACVQLSSLLGLWESAVDMALTIDKNLAIQIANQPPQSEIELRKKLWLKIAKHVVSGKADIQTAMEFLKQCDLIRIEDILPFFSDFVTMDHFKDAICNSLMEYNQHIEDLKEEMEEATKSAELVRKEIQSFRNKYTFIRNSDVCEICEMTLIMRQFYMFPCRHRFHSDCLLKELNPLLGPARRNKLNDLQRQFNFLNTQTIDNISTGSSGMSTKDIVKAEIDNIVASECLYCGENMIRNIDIPFFDENEYESILKEWE